MKMVTRMILDRGDQGDRIMMVGAEEVEAMVVEAMVVASQ
jgi:hypothetical protein